MKKLEHDLNDWTHLTEKWMPPRPELTSTNGIIYFICESEFNQWWDKEIRPLFENATEVLGYKTVNDDYSASDIIRYYQSLHAPVDNTDAVETALVVRKLKYKREDTAEAFLREMFAQAEKCKDGKYLVFEKSLIDKIKTWLARKK